MKKLFFFIAAASLLTLQQAQAQFNNNVVIAHRGAWKEAGLPENSIASLKHAVALGCHASEFDVHLTKDNVIVVNHNDDFYGMDIENATYKELLTIKHPNGESIPTLEDYLTEGMKQKGTKLILEVKTSTKGKERTLQLTKMSVELVKKLKAKNWVEYISFDYDACKLVHELNSKAKVAYLTGDIAPAQVKKDGLTGLDYHYSVYQKNPTWIAEAKQLGLTINAWTVNETAEIQQLIDQKVEYITTNEPELLFTLLKK